MGQIRIRALADGDEADEAAVVDYVVAAQADPARHVVYLGTDRASVSSDLAAVTDWRAATLVARDHTGRVRGVVTPDVDAERGRAWWLGPWADDDATGRALLAAAAELMDAVPEREFSPDLRNTWLVGAATELGYHAEEPSAVLRCDLASWDGSVDSAAVRDLDDDDRAPVAALHDSSFPGTHTRGPDLVSDEGTTVLVTGEPPIGYIATQPQADGTCYVDYIGVARHARRRGVGRLLLATAMTRAADAGLREAFLTVRVGNTAALRLYAALGFTEERRAVPLRLGFRLDG